MTVVYTAVIGNPSHLPEIPTIDLPDVRFVYFTDSKGNPSKPWERIEASEFLPEDVVKLSPRKRSRWFKFHPHVLFNEETLWVDANCTVVGDVREMFQHLPTDIGMFPHPNRTCIQQESKSLARRYSDSSEAIDQISTYVDAGMPYNFGLWAVSVMASHRNIQTDEFFDDLWTEYMNGSERDNIAISYVSWVTGLHISKIPGKFRSNPYVKPGGQQVRNTKLRLLSTGRGKHGWVNHSMFGNADIQSRIPPLPKAITGQRWKIIKCTEWDALRPKYARILLPQLRELLVEEGRLILETANREALLNAGNVHDIFSDADFEFSSRKWMYTREEMVNQVVAAGFPPENIDPLVSLPDDRVGLSAVKD